MKDNRTLADNIAALITSMITTEKRFIPGEKLPNENDLSLMLGISRTTLREAIRILMADGLVEIKRGLGTFVCDPLPDLGSATLNALNDTGASLHDLCEMRLIIEPEAAFYAASRATPQELTRIRELSEQIEACISKNKDRTQLEAAFHRSIANAAHNTFIKQLIPVIQEGIQESITKAGKNQTILADTLPDHRTLVKFLTNRNAEGARHAMKIHILHAIEELEGKCRYRDPL